ncbi:lipopolysaccharide transport periplasmic protein LptA [Marinobacter sp.]|uniref:lipopolysaccharide transport periplasmic protein LptA n=1 Tax=Marinobacter sp. TaxID=50741 RepID=UPI001A05AB7C|nr:lipopolysaccharide transport periplasmic protein LptA [Marinobacter sp.]MBE0486287.1 lipopolysaccharide transport periplasmic protein LptA [Marinobacter sp.]
MKPSGKLAYLLLTTLALTGPAIAFDLDSDAPIRVSADSARLDDTEGTAVYSGDVELTQGATQLNAERVVLYRNQQGLSRIEASGEPARYRQPAREGEAMTDARARTITWSAAENELTFERQAFIEQGSNVFRGDVIRYDTVHRVVTAEGGSPSEDSSGRVEMVIQPRSTGNPTDE